MVAASQHAVHATPNNTAVRALLRRIHTGKLRAGVCGEREALAADSKRLRDRESRRLLRGGAPTAGMPWSQHTSGAFRIPKTGPGLAPTARPSAKFAFSRKKRLLAAPRLPYTSTFANFFSL